MARAYATLLMGWQYAGLTHCLGQAQPQASAAVLDMRGTESLSTFTSLKIYDRRTAKSLVSSAMAEYWAEVDVFAMTSQIAV